ncbi:hypothetical protein ACJ73_01960 [Blastomyces percursus]|uniref:Uncharacterized protein n=1 Tax=Blastomyces percursus TaxID=1658174 RepID=A0A1J9RG92_9EURO|nr:hypothetical protein ACJ73_01960 [Blastomyces percursus]
MAKACWLRLAGCSKNAIQQIRSNIRAQPMLETFRDHLRKRHSKIYCYWHHYCSFTLFSLGFFNAVVVRPPALFQSNLLNSFSQAYCETPARIDEAHLRFDGFESEPTHPTLGIGCGKEIEAEAPPSNHDGNFHTASSITIDNSGASVTDDDGMTELQIKGLVDLARSMSHTSTQSNTCGQYDINLFIDSESDPELDPHNENFNLRK